MRMALESIAGKTSATFASVEMIHHFIFDTEEEAREFQSDVESGNGAIIIGRCLSCPGGTPDKPIEAKTKTCELCLHEQCSDCDGGECWRCEVHDAIGVFEKIRGF